MNPSKFLDQLRALELRLRAPDVQQFVKQQDQPSRDKFAQLRQDLGARIGELTNAELEALGRALAGQDEEITSGITAAQAAAAKLDSISTVLDRVGDAVKIATKIAGGLA